LVVGCKNVLDENEMVSSGLLAGVFDYLIKNYRYVIVDVPSRVLDAYHEYMVDRSDEVLLLSCLDIPSLYRTRQYLDLAKQYLGETKLKLVLNRCTLQAAYRLSNKNLEEELHYPIFARLANDWELNVQANSLGCVLSKVNPNADLVKAIKKLAVQVSGREETAETVSNQENNGLLGKLFKGVNQRKGGDQQNAVSQTELGV
jgi:Flp pilus assembly CpaE family ATPase